MEDFLAQLKPLLWKVGLAALAIGMMLLGCRWLLQWYYKTRNRRPIASSQPLADAGDPDAPIPLASRSTLKTWKVSGVEKANGNDATWCIDAESRANAKVKAELKGMIVTAVERAASE